MAAVYCGSRIGNNKFYKSQAQSLGKILTEKGYGLIYGGGNTGLMCEVASTVIAHNGFVCGVITQLLEHREGVLTDIQEIHIVKTMQERKKTMFERANCFIILPGGTGTMDEFFEVLVLKELNQHQKPIIILNLDGYWDFLLKLLSHMEQEGFLHESWAKSVFLTESVQDVQFFL